jgi:L-threonylcarbamoyladenylate synthase
MWVFGPKNCTTKMPVIGTKIETGAAQLCAGKLVAFATETVYGLGADAQNPEAVERLYALKKRPRNHPVIIHLADFSAASLWAAEIPQVAKKLAAAFMPGPLTLLLPAGPAAAHTTGGGKTVALRVPAHPQAQQLLAVFGGGVAAPSANRFGRLSPTTAAHVREEFSTVEDLYILDGGSCTVGIESTIVSCLNERLSIMRPGMLSADDITTAANGELLPPSGFLRVPGGLPCHYAPNTPLLLAPDVAWQRPPAKTIAALSRHRPDAVPKPLWRQATDNIDDYAHRLYALLRELDAMQADIIWVESPPPQWTAVTDRLKRAAMRQPN